MKIRLDGYSGTWAEVEVTQKGEVRIAVGGEGSAAGFRRALLPVNTAKTLSDAIKNASSEAQGK